MKANAIQGWLGVLAITGACAWIFLPAGLLAFGLLLYLDANLPGKQRKSDDLP